MYRSYHGWVCADQQKIGYNPIRFVGGANIIFEVLENALLGLESWKADKSRVSETIDMPGCQQLAELRRPAGFLAPPDAQSLFPLARLLEEQ